jgi:hypothetical protein
LNELASPKHIANQSREHESTVTLPGRPDTLSHADAKFLGQQTIEMDVWKEKAPGLLDLGQIESWMAQSSRKSFAQVEQGASSWESNENPAEHS